MDFVNTLKGRRFVVPLVFLAALVMLLMSETAYWRAQNAMNNLVTTGTARGILLQMTENLIMIESGQHGYILTGQESLLANQKKFETDLNEAFPKLADATVKISGFRAALDKFQLNVDYRLSAMEKGVRLKREGNSQAAVLAILQNIQTMPLAQSLDDELMALEMNGRIERREAVYQALLLARVGVAILTTVCLLALLLYLRQAHVLGVHQNELKLIEQAVRAELETQVALRTAELTNLTRYLLNAREDERNRLARNLHDDLGALLTSAKLDAARIKARLAKTAPNELELLGHLVASLNACVALGRDIIENLRPSALSNLGLVATLEILTREFSENTGVPVQCELSPVALSPTAELMLYRVVQEALTNISKYANATHVWVRMSSQGGQISLAVRDNGQGFNTQTKVGSSYGLLGMRFRVEAEGGHLTVTSTPGSGTQILATLKVTTAQA
jgi:signal transduction histidine kinase